MVMIFYNGSEEEGRAHWKGLLDLRKYRTLHTLLQRDMDGWNAEPVVDMTKEIPYEMLNSLSVSFLAFEHREVVYRLLYRTPSSPMVWRHTSKALSRPNPASKCTMPFSKR
jgi:hypothetical protein